jgi:hypothetical protein
LNPETSSFLHPVVESRVDDVGLHHQVVVDEVGRIGVVGMNATDLGCGQVDLAGALFGKEVLHRGLVAQVKLSVGAGEDVVL